MKTADIELLARGEVDRCFRQKTLLQQAASEEVISKTKSKSCVESSDHGQRFSADFLTFGHGHELINVTIKTHLLLESR